MTLEHSVHAQRLRVLREAERSGNVSATCRRHGVSRTQFYALRRRFLCYGPDGVAPKRRGTQGGRPSRLSVQTGCEERCAFCIVPSTRGRSRSAPLATILRDVERVAGRGFKEIAVTGVHLGAYGRDLVPQLTLRNLLHAFASVPGDVQFRISSIEPTDSGQEIVDLVARSGRFAPHFHLPLQHASDRMLRAGFRTCGGRL